MIDDLVIGMAGSGGDGVVSRGRVAARRGAVRGLLRHHDQELRLADPRRRVVVPGASLDAPVLNPGGALDVAVALNWDDFLPLRGRAAGRAGTRSSSTRPRPAPHRRTSPRPASRSPGGPLGAASRARQVRRGHRQGEEHRRARPARRLVRRSARGVWSAACAKKFAKKGRGLLAANRSAPSRPARLRHRAPARASPAHWPALPRPQPKLLDRRQRDVRRGGHLRRLRVLRRLSDHAVHRDHAVLSPRALEVRRHRAAGRGRDRRHRRGRRRVVRRQEGDDRHLGPGHVAQDRDAGPGHHRRAAAGRA